MPQGEEVNANENSLATPIVPPKESDADASSELEMKPFRTIWLHPRETVRRIIAVDPKLDVLLLVCLAGIGQMLDRASHHNLGDQMPTAMIVCVTITLGPLGGLFSLWLGSHLLCLSGAWMGSIGDRENLKTAMAWASVPSLLAWSFWIPKLVVFGPELFTKETPRLDSQPILLVAFFAVTFAEIVLSVWSLVLFCNTIAEVQGFRSAWRGLGNILLAGAFLLVPLTLITFAMFSLERI